MSRQTDLSRKEDFYLSVLQYCYEPPEFSLVAPPAGFRNLRKSLDAESSPLDMRLINALLGRIFLGVHATQFVIDVSYCFVKYITDHAS